MTREEAIAFHGEAAYAQIEAEHNLLFARYLEEKYFFRITDTFYDWKFARGLTKEQLAAKPTPEPEPEREPVTFTD